MRVLVLMAAVLTVVTGCTKSPTVSTGMLGNAKYAIASPARWNGNLLLVAPGYTMADAPLSADVDTNATPYKQLIEEGWIVAATSYRRNGMVIRDGSQDVDLLRRHIAEQFGQPRRTFVIGRSMGGAVATIIAETGGNNYHGILAIGAALELRDKTDPYQMTNQPQVPILFLVNQNEMKDSSDYVRQAISYAKPSAVWVVKRDGHCKVNGAEVRQALDALLTCDRTGNLERDRDATITIEGQPSIAAFRDGRAYAKVTHITGGFGNIPTEFVQADMERLGIQPGSHFTVGRADKEFRVFYGKQYADVPKGEWVAFITADGALLIARNLDNAAKALGCQGQEELYIARMPRKQ